MMRTVGLVEKPAEKPVQKLPEEKPAQENPADENTPAEKRRKKKD